MNKEELIRIVNDPTKCWFCGEMATKHRTFVYEKRHAQITSPWSFKEGKKIVQVKVPICNECYDAFDDRSISEGASFKGWMLYASLAVLIATFLLIWQLAECSIGLALFFSFFIGCGALTIFSGISGSIDKKKQRQSSKRNRFVRQIDDHPLAQEAMRRGYYRNHA